jgi:ribosomal protein L30/L7E
MPADGLMKVLPRPKHKSFVKQLGLKDIRSLIALQENKEGEKGVKLLA